MSATERSGTARLEIFDRLAPLLAKVTDTEPTSNGLTEATGLLGQGLGLDSLEVLALVAAIEEEFDLTIDDGQLEVGHFRTLGGLVSFVESRLGR